jgi:peptidoglycan hydrolase-like protein with peptidoglycan-binding domain
MASEQNGRKFVKSLPTGDAREKAIVDAVFEGNHAPIEWAEVRSTVGGRTAILKCATDALKIGKTDSVRITCTHPTAQRIADMLGCVLPTAKMSDLRWSQAANKLPPCLQPADPADRASSGYSPNMKDNGAVLRHHDDVEKAVAGRGGISEPVGKNWRCTQKLKGRPEISANYGLYHPPGMLGPKDKGGRYQAATPAGGKLWQPEPGTAHNAKHHDYTQVVVLWAREVILDGAKHDIEAMARDPELCVFVSAEGALWAMRHPAVTASGEDEPASEDTPITVVTAKPVFSRTLRRGSVGVDVSAWQSIIGAKADGIFGAKTEATTKAWQSARGLTADGVVGPMTRQAAMKEILPNTSLAAPGVLMGDFDVDQVKTILCKNYTWADRKLVHWIVLHSMEAAEKPSTAESVAAWGAGQRGEAPRASWHWAFDCDSAVMCVPEKHVAWHAKAANRYGVGYEHAGWARQTRDEWLDDYSESMLWISSKVAAKITIPDWELPVQYVGADLLKEAKRDYIDKNRPLPDEFRGFTTHKDVTLAMGGSHVDPGPGFPMDTYLGWVRKNL